MKKRYAVLGFIILLIIQNGFATNEKNYCFPRGAIIDNEIILNLTGYGDYHSDLVDGRSATMSVSIPITGNISYIMLQGDLSLVCYSQDRNITDKINCGGITTGPPLVKDKKGRLLTYYNLNCTVTIPAGSRRCTVFLNALHGFNLLESGGECDIPSLSRKTTKDVMAESEYLTKRMLEISKEQTNISKRQTEIMDKQRQAMDESNRMIIFAAIIGVIGVLIGVILGFIFSDFGNYKNTKREAIEKIHEPLCRELDTLKDILNKNRSIKVFYRSYIDRRDHYRRLSDTSYKQEKLPENTEWNRILNNYLTAWIPPNLIIEIKKLYDNETLLKSYDSIRPDTTDANEIKKRKEAKKKILEKILSLYEHLKEQMDLGISGYINDKLKK